MITSSYRRTERISARTGLELRPLLKKLLSFLALVFVTARIWAAEVQSPPPGAAPTPEIGLEELMKMEIPIVEAASKYRQKITEAPASVTVLTADEVKKYGYETLADLLASAPGLYVTYDRNYSFLGMRGFNRGDYNSRVELLIDGHRINNSLSDGAAIGTDFILDVDLIDRVEIIRGPGSSLYGNNAFFGVINVVTRKGRELPGIGAEVSGEVASYDTYKGRVTYGKRFQDGFEFLLSGTIYDSAGQSSLYYPEFDPRLSSTNNRATNNGFATNADDDSYKSFFGSVAFRDFTLQGAYITREKGNPTAQYLTDFNDSRFQTTDDRSYADLKYAHDFPGIMEVMARAYYDSSSFEIVEPYVAQGGTLVQENQTAEWAGTELQFSRRFLDEQLKLTLGGEYRNDFRQDQQIFDARTGKLTFQRETNRQNWGAYIEGDWGIVTNLHLNAGFRYDQYADFDPAFSPRVALIYNPFAESAIKAIYGTAFRTPNFYEQRRTPGAPSYNLQPETISTYELVYEQGIGNYLRSSVAGFYNQIDNLITFNSAPGHQRYENLSDAKAAGTEVSLEGLLPSGVRGRVSYTFQETEDTSSGDVLTDSPQNVAKLNVSAPLWQDKIFAGLEFQYVGARTTTFLTTSGTGVPGPEAPAYYVLNLTLFSQNLLKGLEFSASIYNFLDWKYGDPSTPFHNQAIIDQDGRTFRVKLTYRF